MTEKPHTAAARARLANMTVRRGYDLPAAYRSAPPMVTWRVSECRCRVLSVYLSSDGWVIDGEDFDVPIPEWIDRINPDGTATVGGVPVTLDSYRAGRFAAFNPGTVTGVQQVLDLDVETWPAGGVFEVGCGHWHGEVPLADLAADCAEVKATRAPLRDPARTLPG